MEASTARAENPPGETLRNLARERPALVAFGVIGAIVLVLIAAEGLHEVAQAGLNGLTLGVVYALGAVGLTLVYGILRLVNFAHGDFLTFGAYMAYLVNVTWGLPLAAAICFAMATTALLGLFFERVMWRPMRGKGAGWLQLMLMAIGLAFIIRSTVQWFWGSEIRTLDVNLIDSVEFLGLRIGQTELLVVLFGLVVLIGTGLVIRFTLLGKRMRALSDDLDLAETAGIDTRRVITYTWVRAPAADLRRGHPRWDRQSVRGAGRRPRPRSRDRVVDAGRRAPLEGDVRVRRPDHRPDHPPAGDLR
jgi:neutral amino acid transport system permease protein